LKKITTAAAAALILGGTVAGGAFLAPAAEAATTAKPQVPQQIGYVQRGHTVTVYRDGKVAAKLTATSVTDKHGKGGLNVKVEAKKAFSFRAGQFLREGTDGGDYQTLNAEKKFKTAAKTTKTFRISYDEAGDGEVLWLPDSGEEYIAGAWKVDGGHVEADAKHADYGYVQRSHDGVTVYKNGKVAARVSHIVTSVLDNTDGTLELQVQAEKKFTLVPNSIIWEGADGTDHKPVAGTGPVTVAAHTTKTIDINYKHVDEPKLFWAPGGKTIAMYWVG
jgi:antitoxin (DNA-binding transcriptional repressor) of toxin-antitoxin stability system